MTEPVSSTTIAVTAGGITILGIVTGLQPDLMLAGAAGGWWAQVYVKPASVFARVNRLLLASLIAAWSAPPTVAWLGSHGWISTLIPVAAWQWCAALGIGLIAIDALGGGVLGAVRNIFAALVRRATGGNKQETDK